MIKYSKIKDTCFDMNLNYKDLPNDLVEITNYEHLLFMGIGVQDGKVRKPGVYPFVIEDLPDKSLAQLEAEYTNALDHHLNSKATERGYDSIHTAALRAAVPLSPFHNEGMAYAIWMDECYQLGHQVLADVKSGKITLPTIEEFIASLPVLELPL